MNRLGVVWPEHVGVVLAAVSGGADSVALLAMLREQAGEEGRILHAAHFEHGIRGQASLDDAAFVSDLCEKWGIELHMGHADVPTLAAEKGMGLEEAAREARYAFLRSVKAEIGADCIVVAHHLDDQAETVLMHLFRGAGLKGASGMRERDGDLFRPLLGIRKSELTAYLRERGIPWREDATNEEACTPRNSLRIEAVPAIERVYPGAVRALGRFAALAACEDEYMEAETDRLMEETVIVLTKGYWLTERENMPEALLRRTLRRLVPSLDAEACAAAASLYRMARGTIELKKGVKAEKTEHGLFLLMGDFKCTDSVPVPREGRVRLEGVGELNVEMCCARPVTDDPFCQVMDRDSAAGACLRTRRPGDTIVPLGMTGRQKLSDYFINHHIDRPLRDRTPLLARGNDVLWVVGAGISEYAKLKNDSAGVRMTFRLNKKGWRKDV